MFLPTWHPYSAVRLAHARTRQLEAMVMVVLLVMVVVMVVLLEVVVCELDILDC